MAEKGIIRPPPPKPNPPPQKKKDKKPKKKKKPTIEKRRKKRVGFRGTKKGKALSFNEASEWKKREGGKKNARS